MEALDCRFPVDLERPVADLLDAAMRTADRIRAMDSYFASHPTRLAFETYWIERNDLSAVVVSRWQCFREWIALLHT